MDKKRRFPQGQGRAPNFQKLECRATFGEKYFLMQADLLGDSAARYCMGDVGGERGDRAAGLEGRPETGLDSLMAILHPDIEWVPVQSDPEYSVHRGHDDVRAWLTSWAESFPDLRWELDRILDAGSDLVVAFVRHGGPL